VTPHLADTPVLTTERLVLRAPAPADYAAWKEFYLTDRAGFVGGGTDVTAGQAWRAFAATLGHWAIHGHGTFTVTDRATGRPVGGVGPWYPDGWPEPEIGWMIWTPEAEGKGVAAEATLAVRRHVYRDLGWRGAVSYIDRNNPRSIALAERLGCRVDEGAAKPEVDAQLMVFRHPGPEAADAG